MPVLLHLWNEVWDYFRQGLVHLNPILGIVIALIGGLMVAGFGHLFVVALLAVVLHILAETLIPVVLDRAPFALPALDHGLFHYAVSLYIAYFVVIGLIYLARLLFAGIRR